MNQFDDLLDAAEEIVYDGPKGQEAERLLAAASALEPGVDPRAEYLRSAVWWLKVRGDLDGALRCAEDAIADGGETWVDPRGDLISVLLAKADPRADEVIRELRRALIDLPDPTTLIEMVAEDLREHGRAREALRWLSIGVADFDPADIEDDAFELAGLLRARSDLRRELGRGRDAFDLAAERIQRAMDERDRIESGDVGIDPQSMLLTMLWWPEPEFDAFVARWPHMAEGYGGSADGHRAETEQHLRRYASEGVRITVGAGVFTDFLSYTAEHDLDPLAGQARARYAAELGRTGRATPFPPGRNDRCWCGSGVKYKRCCGTAGSTQ